MTREYRDPYTGAESKGIEFKEPSKTLQSAAAECDIYNIINQFQTTGIVTHVASGIPQYADVSEVPDYQSALEIIMNAEEQFASLPSNVRREFDNDPGKLLEFIQNPDNYERGVELGLFVQNNSLDNNNNSSSVDSNLDVGLSPSDVVPPSPAAK